VPKRQTTPISDQDQDRQHDRPRTGADHGKGHRVHAIGRHPNAIEDRIRGKSDHGQGNKEEYLHSPSVTDHLSSGKSQNSKGAPIGTPFLDDGDKVHTNFAMQKSGYTIIFG
ncbi:MAG: hypothetical protein ACI85V_001684, partial [bacterium]